MILCPQILDCFNEVIHTKSMRQTPYFPPHRARERDWVGGGLATASTNYKPISLPPHFVRPWTKRYQKWRVGGVRALPVTSEAQHVNIRWVSDSGLNLKGRTVCPTVLAAADRYRRCVIADTRLYSSRAGCRTHASTPNTRIPAPTIMHGMWLSRWNHRPPINTIIISWDKSGVWPYCELNTWSE